MVMASPSALVIACAGETLAPELPEDGELVVVLASGKPCENITLVDAYEMAEYSRDDNCSWILEMWPMWEDAKVTHWMPLPEPPAED